MIFKNKSILVTGGTGSFGQAFIEEILNNHKPKKIVVYSRDEMKQYLLKQKLRKYKGNKIRYFIGDIRDLNRLNLAMQDIDFVVHAAALKQVDTAEYNPFEAVKTNVIGSQNVIESALKNNIKKVIALSTDKACSPINLYGATKLTSDKLFINANNYKGSKRIIFSVVRYGNVFGSRGSVIHTFLKQKKKNIFTVTHKDMTRFSITINEAVNFVINSLKIMQGGEIFVPKLYSYNILDLIKSISVNPTIKEIGLRSGEKINEEMISENETNKVLEFKNFYIIVPNSEYFSYKYSRDRKSKIKKSFSYNSKSNSHFLSRADLKKLIKNYFKENDIL